MVDKELKEQIKKMLDDMLENGMLKRTGKIDEYGFELLEFNPDGNIIDITKYKYTNS